VRIGKFHDRPEAEEFLLVNKAGLPGAIIMSAYYKDESGEQSKPRQARKRRRRPGGEGGWPTEPNVGRVAHGVPLRNHRLARLGGTVVPRCAREAFKRLMGL